MSSSCGVRDGCVRECAERPPLLRVHRHDAFDRGSDLPFIALALQPGVGRLEELQLDVLDDPQHEVVAVAEVDVEGGPLEARAAHDLLDRHLSERTLAQERLGRHEDLAFGVARVVPGAAAAMSTGR